MMLTIHTHRCPDYLTYSVQACNSYLARTARCPALTILFQNQKQNLATEPSVWSARLYGTVYQFVKLTACIHLGTSSKQIAYKHLLNIIN